MIRIVQPRGHGEHGENRNASFKGLLKRPDSMFPYGHSTISHKEYRRFLKSTTMANRLRIETNSEEPELPARTVFPVFPVSPWFVQICIWFVTDIRIAFSKVGGRTCLAVDCLRRLIIVAAFNAGLRHLGTRDCRGRFGFRTIALDTAVASIL